MINTELIKNRMRELNLTQTDVAVVLGVKKPTANQKINRVRGISLDEANKLAHLLQLTDEEFKLYFFA